MKKIAMNMLVVYVGKAGAEIATEVSQSLGQKLGRRFQIGQSVWNAELFMSQKLRAQAAREAAASDVVIIATAEGASLDENMNAWLKLWRVRQHRTPSALVALLRRGELDTPHFVKEQLQDFAAKVGMDFFCHSEVNPQARKQAAFAKQMVLQ